MEKARKRLLPALLVYALLLSACGSPSTGGTQPPGGAGTTTDNASSGSGGIADTISIAPTEDRGTLPALTTQEGITLTVGMGREECEELIGQRLIDGYITSVRIGQAGTGVLCVDDAVLWLSGGSLDNGVEIGMPLDRAGEILGNYDYMVPIDPENRYPLHRYYYGFSDGDVMELRTAKDDNDVAKAGTVMYIAIYGAQYEEGMDAVLGQVFTEAYGSVDAVVESVMIGQYIIYSLSNTKAMRAWFVDAASGKEYELTSMCSAGNVAVNTSYEVRTQEYLYGSLHIETEGLWELVLYQPKSTNSYGAFGPSTFDLFDRSLDLEINPDCTP